MKNLEDSLRNLPQLERTVRCLKKDFNALEYVREILDINLDSAFELTISYIDQEGVTQTQSTNLSSLIVVPEFKPTIVVDNYNELVTVTGQVLYEFAEVENSQGTQWLPGTLGGTYRGAGLYYWNGTEWINDNDKIYEAFQNFTISVNNIVNNLNQEITDRTNADNALQLQVDSKVQSVTGTGVDNTDPLNPILTISNGIDGQDGDSAYQIWLNAGNIGTEQDFIDSLEGAQGIQGIQGIQGNPGADSTVPGPQGIQGVPGNDGTNGLDGNDGDSAYEVAVAGGFIGTEVQWLASLIGPQGIQGIAGINGTDGVDGPPGPIVGLNGLTDTNLPTPDIGDLVSWDGTNWINIVQPIDEFLEATITNTQQLAPGTAYQDVVLFDTATPNTLVGGNFNVTTGEFTCTEAGVYKFEFQTTMNQYFGNNRTDAFIRLVLNGVLVKGTEQAGYHRNIADGKDNYSFSKSISLVPGVVIKVQARNGDADRDQELLENSTLFRITKIKQ